MRTKKTGVLTLSLGLIVCGSLLFLVNVDLIAAEAFKYIGPIFLILFGLEMIWGRRRKSEQPARISGLSVAFVVLTMIVSLSQTSGLAIGLLQHRYFSPVSGEVPVSGAIQQVNIRIPEGKIIVTGTDEAVLSYEGELTAFGASQAQADEATEANWTVRTSGEVVELILERPGIPFSLFQLFQWDFEPPVLHVVVPQALLTNVQTDNGDIDLQDMRADVELKSSNGAIAVRNISGNVKAETSNGSQTAQHIDGSARLRTQNGAITFADVSGALSAHSSNGRIKGESAVKGKWDLQTSNGKIDLTVPANTNAAIRGKTSNGSFGGNIEWEGDGRDERSAVLGTGEHPVTLTTSNGSISVDERTN